MFGLRKKALVKAVCGTVTLMGMLPWGIASAETGPMVVTAAGDLNFDGNVYYAKSDNSNNNYLIFNWDSNGLTLYDGFKNINNETTATADNNVLIFNCGNKFNISAGVVYGSKAKYESEATASASGNILILNGGTSGNPLTSDNGVYGGYLMTSDGSPSASGPWNVKDNIVIVRGTKIYGDIYAGAATSFTGATVENNNVMLMANANRDYKTIHADNISVFTMGNTADGIMKSGSSDAPDTLNFYVPTNATASSPAMLTINNGTNGIDLSSTIMNIGVTNGAKLKKGDTVQILDIKGDNSLPTNYNFTDEYDDVTKGILSKTAQYGITAGSLITVDATINPVAGSEGVVSLTLNEDIGPSEASKSLVETRAGGMAFLNNAADLAIGKGLLSAQAASEADNNKGYTPFAALGAADMRYETGSYVDSKGWGINVGFSRILNYENSKVTLAPLVEYGRANYASHLDDGTRGDGYNQYLGLGFLAKDELKNGTYFEGSARFGHMKGDYNGDVNTDFANYGTDSNYLAFHAGVGKVVDINADSNIDYYGKFFYTHQTSDTVDVKTSLGDTQFDFDSINSYRTRLGARWNKKLNARDTFYAGLAWDYEFDSEARGTFNGLSTPAPTMKGSSGMLELGWKMKASKENPVSVDLGLNGWVGKQRGVSFNAGFSWEF